MITLKFSVSGQRLIRTVMPVLIRDSKNYIRLEFSFITKDWADCVKTVILKSNDGKEGSKILNEDNTMILPTEIAAAESFTVSIFGENRAADIRIPTNPLEIKLGASGYSDVGEFEEPLPSVYEQILDACKSAVETAEDVKKRADSGDFNGDDYALTDADKKEIAEMVNPTPSGYDPENKDVLEKLGDDNGTLTYKGNPIGGSGAIERPTAEYVYDFVEDFRMWYDDSNPFSLYILDEEATDEEKAMLGKEIADVEFVRLNGEQVSIKNMSEVDFLPYISMLNHITKSSFEDMDTIVFASIYYPSTRGWLGDDILNNGLRKIHITYYTD